MMEERKFVCKYCSKRFPCGKSLGGHIRTHMTEERNNAEKNNIDDDHHHLKLLDSGRKRKRERDSSWPEAAGAAAGGSSINNNPIYGLRENPRKTTRFVHIDATLAQEDERFCKECGKGFPSLKALCGHMACHSEKEKGINYTEDQKLVMDSQSDTKSSGAPTHPRRSKRMKFKTINLSNQPSPPSAPLPNGSSSVSEVEQEQEEVARMLIMLSRDSSHKSRFASVAESSDTNSVVLETTAKSSSPETRVAAKSNGKSSNFVSSNAYGVLHKKQFKDMKFKCAVNSDSGHVRYGLKTKMVESDVQNYYKFNNKGWNVRENSDFGDYDAESRKVLKKDRSKYTEAAAEYFGYDRTDGTTRKFDSKKRASNYDSLGGHNSANISTKKIANGFTNDEIYENNGKKAWKYDSLGSDYDGSYDSSEEESNENSTDTDSFPAPKSRNNKATNGKKSSKVKKKLNLKKIREHECPICYRIFRSGQALGGHKRSHFIGGSEEKTLVIKQGAPVVPCLIDLNLPAPVDD